MANFGIIRTKKVAGNGLGGMRSHVNREHESKTNPDIDPSKTKDNYTLECDAQHLGKRVNARIKSLNLKKAVRKDAVKLVDLVVTASPEAMEKMSKEQRKEYFTAGLNFIKDFFGAENVMYSQVHVDEDTDHAHIGVVPITKDGRLCAKEVVGRVGLCRLQDEFYEKVLKDFGLDRGEKGNTTRKHIETARFKADQAEKRAEKAKEQEQRAVANTEEIVKQAKLIKLDINKLDDVVKRARYKEKSLFSKATVEMDKEDFWLLSNIADRSIKSALAYVESDNKRLDAEKRANKVESLLTEEKAKNEKLTKENTELQKANNGFALIPQQFRAYVNEGIESDKRHIKQAMHDYNKTCAVAMIVSNGDTEKAKKFLGKDFSSRLIGTKISQDNYLKACAANLAAQVVFGKEPVKKSNDDGWAFPHPSKTDYKEPISKSSSLVLDKLMGEKVYGINECGPTLADMTSNDAEKFKEWPYLSEATRSKLEKDAYLKAVRI